MLDGGIGDRAAARGRERAALDERLWGIGSLVDAPDAVLRVHRGYVAAGCDVITTNTWGLPTALAHDGVAAVGADPLGALGRRRAPRRCGSRARRSPTTAARASARSRSRSTATSTRPHGRGDDRAALARCSPTTRPTSILVETLSLVRAVAVRDGRGAARDRPAGVAVASAAAATGCAASTASTGAARRATRSGAPRAASSSSASRALLINCIPPDHVDGMVSYLRDFTDLPLGVYPNLGYFTNDGWRFDTGRRRRRSTRAWRSAGGTRARRSSAAAAAPGPSTSSPRASACATPRPAAAQRRRAASRRATLDARRPRPPRPRLDRPPPPAAVPAAVPGPRLPSRASPVPSAVSFMVWRHLFERGRRRAPALPRRRLRDGHPDRPARAQRRVARARDRRRPARGRQHADERVPQRRRRPRHRDRRRPLPVGAGGALRGDRREPPRDARRPVPAGRRAPAGRLLGARPARPADRASCREALAPEGVAYVVQLSVASQAAHARAARGAPGSTARVVD